MDFPTPLVRGRLIQRYKRFLADIELEDGSVITAHCPNPGAMIGLNMPGLTCWISHDPSPKRKLPYTWELVEVPSHDGKVLPVGLNTMHPNRLVAEALAAAAIPEIAGYSQVRREVKYGLSSRVDFLLETLDRSADWLREENGQPKSSAPSRLWLEVKNCHLSRTKGLAEFPDCVAARSTKHLGELAGMVRQGDRAAILFVVQRTDCDRFQAAADCDPAFAVALDRAVSSGVELYVYGCEVTPIGITLATQLRCTHMDRVAWNGTQESKVDVGNRDQCSPA